MGFFADSGRRRGWEYLKRGIWKMMRRKKMRDAIEETLSVHFEGAVGVAMVETENLKLLDAVEPLS